MTVTARQIIKKIGCDNLELVKGDGYWYFVYDDFEATGRYETRSIFCMYLNQMSIDKWINDGRDFVTDMEHSE